jgi:hypothetical protein
MGNIVRLPMPNLRLSDGDESCPVSNFESDLNQFHNLRLVRMFAMKYERFIFLAPMLEFEIE